MKATTKCVTLSAGQSFKIFNKAYIIGGMKTMANTD